MKVCVSRLREVVAASACSACTAGEASFSCIGEDVLAFAGEEETCLFPKILANHDVFFCVSAKPS
jgi:hypothetical protein